MDTGGTADFVSWYKLKYHVLNLETNAKVKAVMLAYISILANMVDQCHQY